MLIMKKSKLTVHTMAAGKMVFMQDGVNMAELFLLYNGCSKRNASQWVKDWAIQCCKAKEEARARGLCIYG